MFIKITKTDCDKIVKNWWFNVRRRLRPFGGEHTLWLMGGCIKVNMGRAA